MTLGEKLGIAALIVSAANFLMNAYLNVFKVAGWVQGVDEFKKGFTTFMESFAKFKDDVLQRIGALEKQNPPPVLEQKASSK